jgi:hypothetical protein
MEQIGNNATSTADIKLAQKIDVQWFETILNFVLT